MIRVWNVLQLYPISQSLGLSIAVGMRTGYLRRGNFALSEWASFLGFPFCHPTGPLCPRGSGILTLLRPTQQERTKQLQLILNLESLPLHPCLWVQVWYGVLKDTHSKGPWKYTELGWDFPSHGAVSSWGGEGAMQLDSGWHSLLVLDGEAEDGAASAWFGCEIRRSKHSHPRVIWAKHCCK